MTDSSQRRLAAILAADVVGYSRLMGADETATLNDLERHRRELIEPKAKQHHGRIFKLMGDGILMEFVSVVDAVLFAIDVQSAMRSRNNDVRADRRIEFRIGINIGDVIAKNSDVYGDGVNVASRLEASAEPGGISLSHSARDQVRDKLDITLVDQGEHAFKNISRPIGVYRIAKDAKAEALVSPVPKLSEISLPLRIIRNRHITVVAVLLIIIASATALWRPWQPEFETVSVAQMAFPLPEKPSIAVMPFINMSGDPEQEYFADGMTEDLITDLSSISGLFVIARNSTFVYKGRSIPARQVSEDLGVRFVLEGSVRRSGDQIRVNAQLVDATTGGQLWAERYDGFVADIFEVQDLFVKEIISALPLNLPESERKDSASGQTTNVQARVAFQKGWERYLRYTAEDNALAVKHLKQAVEIDPTYGRAFAALGLVYVRGCQWRWHEELGTDPGSAFNTAVSYVAKGEENSSSLTKVAASQISLYDNQHDSALTEAARAVALDPNDPEAQVAMGLVMITTGKPEAGLAFIETALRLSPTHPSHYSLAHALAYFAMNDLGRATSILSEAVAKNPNTSDLMPLLSAGLAQLGRREDARDTLLQWRPQANQLELEREILAYHFPYKWSFEARFLERRLKDGLNLAVVPLEVTVDTLIQQLEHGDALERISAAAKLGLFGPLAADAVPALIDTLGDKDYQVLGAVLNSLEKIGPASKAAVPALTDMLDNGIYRFKVKRTLEYINEL